MATLLDLLGAGNGNPPIPAVNQQNTTVPASAPDAPVHKGLFGIHGTARDVLGLIGDALSGNHYYAQTRQKEKLADAMSGFTDDPLAAVKRVSAIDPNAGQALFNNVVKQKAAEAQQRATDELAQYRKAQAQGQAANRLGAMAGSLTPENYDKMMPIIQNYAKTWGFELPAAPSAFSPEYKSSLQAFGIDPDKAQALAETERHHGVLEGQGAEKIANQRDYQQGQLGLGAQRVAIARQNADNSAANAGAGLSLRQQALAEEIRHNKATEGVSQQRANVYSNRGAGGVKPGVAIAKGADGKYHFVK